MKSKRKLFIALGASAASLAALTATSLAVFTDTKIDDTTITTGDVSISAVASNPAGTDGYITASSAQTLRVSDSESVNAIKYDITNDGSKRAYVRAQIIPVVQVKQGSDWVTDTSVSIADLNVYVTTGNDASVDSWIYSEGYYYFPNVVNSGDSFSVFIGSDAEESADKRVIYDIDIQASQATHNAYAKNWDIQGLPAGVEVLKSNY